MLVTFRISIVLKGIHTKLESWTPSTVLCLHSVTTVWQKSIPLFGNPDVQILLSKAHPPKPSLCSANKYHVTSIKANSSRPLLLDCSRVSPISPPGPSVWLQEGRGFIFGEIFKIQNFWDSLDCTNYIKLLYIYIYKLQSTELTGMSHSCPSPACDCVILSLLTTSLHLICPPNSLK